MRRIAVIAVCLVVALAALANVTTALAGAGTGPLDARASQYVSYIASGDMGSVLAQADSTVSSQASASQLADAWNAYQQTLGTYQSAGTPVSTMCGDLTVEQVPLQLANGSGEIRLALHSDGTIAGIYFTFAGMPVIC